MIAGWRLFLAFGAAVSVAFMLAPTDGLLQALLFPAMHAAAVVALVGGLRRHRPECVGVWWVLVASQSSTSSR